MANRKMTISKTKIAKSLSLTKAGSVKQIGLAAAFMLSATNVHALGLGSLEIDSNLDQPLNGQIELRVADGDDVSSITAAIASEEEFESLGIDYPGYLKDFSLSVTNNGNDVALNVSSNGIVIKEPFIHFLVRVEWSGGSFLREYTALIDPPIYAAASPQSLSEPRVVGTDQSYSSNTVDTTDVSEQTYDEVLSDDTDSYEADIQDDEVTSAEPLIEDDFYNEQPTSTDVVEQASAALGDARYGPVESGESLSVIASDLQSQFPDLSIYQIMKVLFDENESSFIGGNINGLIKGSILNIGDLSAIRAVDVAESKEFYITQINEWDPASLISPSTDSVNVGQDNYTDSSDDYSFDSPSDGTSESERFQVGASTEEDNYVSSDQGATQDGEVLALRQEISQLETSLASSELEKQDLNERISLLEGQLSDMNRLVDLNVESSELAALESNLKDQNDNLALEEELSSEQSAIDEFLIGTEETTDGLLDSASDVTSDIGDFATDATDSLLDTVDETAEETGISEFITDIEDSGDALVDSAINSVDDAASVIETAVDTKPAPIVEPEASILDTIKDALFGSGLWKILAGLGALIVAGLGILFLRNRRADEEFEISMLSIESNSQSVDGTQSMNSASHSASMSMSQSVAEDDGGSDKETSFLTVYSDSDAVVQADEVDPVAEADVYIAYGRDEQAEEVLLDGVVSHPERIDIKHKLLSLYFKRQNVEGFERIAEELYSQRAALTGDTWEQISQMGKEIAPHNPLFELDGNDLSASIDANSELKLEGENIDEVSIEIEPDNEGESPEINYQVSDRLDEVITVGEESEMIVNSLEDDDSIQLVDFEDGRSEVSDLEDVDMDALDFGDAVDNKVVASDSSPDDDDNVLEFNMDDDTDIAVNDDAGDISFSDAPEVSDLEIDADYDEARTQYELAKVFVDLGDEDGARKILDEIVASKETSEGVLADSQALLDSMNS